MKVKVNNANVPVWKTVTVKTHLPEALKKLDELAHNLWWTWNVEGLDLFRSLDKELFKKVDQNPIELLSRLSYERLTELSQDPELIARMDKVYANFRKYMDVKPDSKRPSVAYFCMEYGLNHILKIYSGGLGILAGDYLKEASDSNVDLCAVGFLYRYGYFTQTLSMDGQQIANYEPQDFDHLPIERVLDENGAQVIVDVPFPNYQVHAAVWRVNVGRIALYLLDTDNPMNSEYDRTITHTLYGGDWENRLKQEYLLGIGGMLMLHKLGIKKDIYLRADSTLTRRSSWFALRRSIPFIRPCLPVTTISTSRSLASIWALSPAASAFRGTTLWASAARTPTTMARSSACRRSSVKPARRSTALAGCTAR